jgi:hypothetical protein
MITQQQLEDSFDDLTQEIGECFGRYLESDNIAELTKLRFIFAVYRIRICDRLIYENYPEYSQDQLKALWLENESLDYEDEHQIVKVRLDEVSDKNCICDYFRNADTGRHSNICSLVRHLVAYFGRFLESYQLDELPDPEAAEAIQQIFAAYRQYMHRAFQQEIVFRRVET